MFERQNVTPIGVGSAALKSFGAARVPASPPTLRVGSTQLLSGGRELVIEHAGQEYHLRLTRNDKLILTK